MRGERRGGLWRRRREVLLADEKSERKEKGLPSNMLQEIYEALMEVTEK